MKMNRFLKHKKIIITGASSGIGERLSWHIAKNGGIPIMVARSYEKLRQNQVNIQQAFHIHAPIYISDLCSEEGQAVFKEIIQQETSIDGLLNNAGFGLFESILDADMVDIRNMYELNVFAVMQAVQTVLPHLLHNQAGHIVNIVSQAGKLATPKSSGYASSKHAILGYTNVLRQEVSPLGIHVTAVNLGPVATNFFTKADPNGTYVENVQKYMLDANDVAEKVVATLFHRKREINMPWWMEIGSKLYQIAPTLMETVLKRQFNKK